MKRKENVGMKQGERVGKGSKENGEKGLAERKGGRKERQREEGETEKGAAREREEEGDKRGEGGRGRDLTRRKIPLQSLRFVGKQNEGVFVFEEAT